MKPYWLAILLLAFVALRFAQPIEDGDLFWHMKYGSQMLERGTLRTDHSLYSWMPAANTDIYCAWTGELLFLGLWKALGIAGIFALRYAVVLAMIALLAWHTRRCGALERPEAWLAILIAVLGSVVATMPKPEMLSLLLWNGLVFCWFAALGSSQRLRWFYAMPAILLLWVNTHGGFTLAAPFLAVNLIAGFLLFPRRDAIHLLAATALCGVVTVINPYGIRYPAQLIRFAFDRSRPDIAWNNAFQPTWSTAGNYYHLPELLVWMALMAIAMMIGQRSRERWAIAALFVAYVPLYVMYVRSAFLLPAIFAYGFIYLCPLVYTRGSEERRAYARDAASAAVAVLALLFLGGRSLYQAAEHPSTGSWMGFGISALQPVEEAEYLAQNNFGPRIYNTYNAGGYLLWRLYPRDRVMVDARSFPYLGWFGELIQFTRTTNPGVFQAFLAKYPGDVALADFQEDATWRSFLSAPGWRPAFYGPDAVVFVPAAKAPGPLKASPKLAELRNGETAARVFAFAIAVADYRTAWNVLGQMRGPLHRQMREGDLQFASEYHDGHVALAAHEYQTAWDHFEKAFYHRPVTGQDNTILLLLKALQKVSASDPQAGVLRAGLDRLSAGSTP